MHCPKCGIDINDDHPSCPQCGFSMAELDTALGSPPTRAGPVTDLASVISEAGGQRLQDRLQAFRDRTGCAFDLVTVAATAPRLPSEYVFWIFNRWKIGGEAHRGLLLLLAMQERRIEVEVGYSLEDIVSDAAAGAILQAHAVPFLKKGDVDGGLYHAVDILARLMEDGVRQEASA